MLVGIWLVKAVLMRSQVEIRNMLLDHGEKAILCYKVAGNLAELDFVEGSSWPAMKLNI